MTEDEAMTRTCHKTLIPITSTVGASVSFETAGCIGSACMAWRWDYAWSSSTEEGQGGDLVLRLKPLKNGKPRMGWCGLAGKP